MHPLNRMLITSKLTTVSWLPVNEMLPLQRCTYDLRMCNLYTHTHTHTHVILCPLQQSAHIYSLMTVAVIVNTIVGNQIIDSQLPQSVHLTVHNDSGNSPGHFHQDIAKRYRSSEDVYRLRSQQCGLRMCNGATTLERNGEGHCIERRIKMKRESRER